jgi:hypothetical protein
MFKLHANPPQVLEEILARCKQLGNKGVLIFDLDSTLFDNRPRQVRILREFGELKTLPALIANQIHHWKSGWDMQGAMVSAGLPPAQTESLMAEAKEFWRERFFTSTYSECDVAIPGAAAFLRDVVATGAQVLYLTGRHEGMRAGSVRAMELCDFPVPDAARGVRLMMKPTLAEDDDAFKEFAVAEVKRLGQVLAAFDNEPTHANGYRRSFPEAKVVHLATDHSGRPVPLLEGIVSIPDFAR